MYNSLCTVTLVFQHALVALVLLLNTEANFL